MNGSVLETGARVAATAGEILTITYCYSYWYTNGVAETPPVGDPDGCFSVEIIPEEDEYFVQCGLKQQGRQCAESEWEPKDGCDIFDYGFEEVYAYCGALDE